jgi:glutathione synthase/RimK-type ligase-like ATP-grasp enzyme
MTIWVHTNGRPSASASLLAKQDDFKRVIKGFKVRQHEIVINWGSSVPVDLKRQPRKVLNCSYAVANAVDKLRSFAIFKEHKIPTPEWTTDREVAQRWSAEDFVIFARTNLTGQGGDGIIVVNRGDEVPNALLYTKYIFKDKEYRAHVMHNRVFDISRKIRHPEREVVNWKIRNHENGFMYVRNHVELSHEAERACINAVSALKLEFGAVDLIVDKQGFPYVLEVNTAPGLEGQTVLKYANQFKNY